MEMQYFWLLDQVAQQYFKLYYQPGLENLTAYPTKHHLLQIHHMYNCITYKYLLRQQNFCKQLNQVYVNGVLESWAIPIYDMSHCHGFLITKNPTLGSEPTTHTPDYCVANTAWPKPSLSIQPNGKSILSDMSQRS